jgi:hypothetical protein
MLSRSSTYSTTSSHCGPDSGEAFDRNMSKRILSVKRWLQNLQSALQTTVDIVHRAAR